MPMFQDFGCLPLRLDPDDQVVRRNEVADLAGQFVRRAEQNRGALQIPDRCLRIDIELAQRLDIVPRKFDTNGELILE